jgi:hypothetical protein
MPLMNPYDRVVMTASPQKHQSPAGTTAKRRNNGQAASRESWTECFDSCDSTCPWSNHGPEKIDTLPCPRFLSPSVVN